MEFNYFMPTRIISGEDSVVKNSALFADYGKTALIVTSPSSKKSGALRDTVSALEKQGIGYYIVDDVKPNPAVSSFNAAHAFIKEFYIDFIVGIGGGSPMDASKAYAVLAANDIPPMRLFDNAWENPPLPLILIPTTAGTGSEVTPYSVLTIEETEQKKAFSSPLLFPRICFLDASYTSSLPVSVCVDTAVDFLAHAVEGYIYKNTSPLSDALALEAIRVFARELPHLKSPFISFDSRSSLLYAASVAGMVISQTRTIGLHSMGYALTTVRDIPHGRANGLLMTEFLLASEKSCKDKIRSMLDIFGFNGLDEFGEMMSSLLDDENEFTLAEIRHFTDLVAANAIARDNPRRLDEEDVFEIFAKSLIPGYKEKGKE